MIVKLSSGLKQTLYLRPYILAPTKIEKSRKPFLPAVTRHGQPMMLLSPQVSV